MNNERKNTINIISQAFYGNRTATEVSRENIDRFILGYLDNNIPIEKPIDRTIVHVPNTDNIVIVYNKYKEEESRKLKEEAFNEANYVMKPLAVIEEENIEIYSRCIACRMNADGELESLLETDYDKIINYMAE